MSDQGTRLAAHDDGRRLVDVAKDRLGAVAIREVGELLRGGGVLVDGRPGAIDQVVRAGANLTLAPGVLAALRRRGRVTEPSPRTVGVVHDDEHLVVVDKPAGMHVHPLGAFREDTLVGVLLWRAGARPGRPWAEWRPRPTHRLDRPTSGLVLVAKDAHVQRAVDLLRAEGRATRTYRATVTGVVRGEVGTIDVPLGIDPIDDRRRGYVPRPDGGQEAVTHWRVVARSARSTTLELRLDTGRTHQIRAHLAHLGHPLVGDSLYAGAGSDPLPAATVGMALRAVALDLPHPLGGAHLHLETRPDPPADGRV